ncbi:MAG: hypothetical protein IT290_09815 [Deltaproteobacteria bacterium]|nr:hypothetical protein [Deltaproteobacteria bacterium]
MSEPTDDFGDERDGYGEIFDVAKIRARQQRVERYTVGIVVLFLFSLGTAYVLTDGEVVRDPAAIFRPRGPIGQVQAVNCEDKRNLHLKVCQDRMTEELSRWRAIERFQEGKGNVFSLHGNDK